jgi:DNA segregation ATPase FtsK/SpoIIIE-like protein
MAAVMEEKSALGLREVVLLLFSALVFFILISLVTFNKEDAGFSHSGSLQSIHNACGVVGAWISDFTLSLFGLMAYCLPVMLGWIGYLVYRDQLHTENNLVIIIRYIGFVITLAFGSALFYLHLLRTVIALPVGTGGILGQELGDFAVVMLGNSGGTLVLLVGLLAGITLLTDLSWFKLMDNIGKYTLVLFQSGGRMLGGLEFNFFKEGDVFSPPLAETDALSPQAPKPDEDSPKQRQKLKISLVMDKDGRPTDGRQAASEDAKLSVDKGRLPDITPSRHEPQFDGNFPEEEQLASKFSATPAKKQPAAKVAEPRLGRQEPQFDRQPQRASAPDTHSNDRLTARNETLRDAPKFSLPDKALSARVMGFDVQMDDEPTLGNFPPQLNGLNLENFPPQLDDLNLEAHDYPPALSASKVASWNVEKQALPSRAKSDRDEPSFPPLTDVHSQPQFEDKQVKAIVKPFPQFPKMGNVLPDLALLDERDTRVNGYTATDLEEMSRLVEAVLQDFGVLVDVVAVHPGPVITRFELQPAPGVKVSRISGLNKDIARALSVTSVRIVENIPGKSVIGLEIPNQEREMVTLRELLVSPAFKEAKSVLTLAMGKDIAGMPVVADLGKMPHALVAGTTGSGKSVAINTMILSLLYKATPEQVRIIMIDPKMLELSVYEGIPHLLTPVVTDMKEASNALRWAVAEMERRYKLMSKMGVRNIAGFNLLVTDAAANGQTIRDPMFQYDKPLSDFEAFPVLTTLPSIVIVIDELADMMMIVGKKVEELIARLAQKARAAGIHLILATQRPSVDVLTGLIKANVPTRISFQVSSRIDSRTILDQGGAETLLGNGDMLFLPSGTAIPIRAHGAFVDDHEVHRVVEFLKQTAPPNYLDEITREVSETGDAYSGGSTGDDAESDALYDEAVRFVTESRKASISSVQRKFKIGYNRAARMIEDMEAAGVVSAAESNGSREVLAPAVPRPEDN